MTTASNTSAPLLNYSYTALHPKRTIRYIRTHDGALRQAGSSASALRGPFLGFDVEWRPNFVKGAPPSRVALLQLASKHEVLLFQIFRVGQSAISSKVHYHVLSDLWTCDLRPTPDGSPRTVTRYEHKESRSGYQRHVFLCLPLSYTILTSEPRSRHRKTPTRLER